MAKITLVIILFFFFLFFTDNFTQSDRLINGKINHSVLKKDKKSIKILELFRE